MEFLVSVVVEISILICTLVYIPTQREEAIPFPSILNLAASILSCSSWETLSHNGTTQAGLLWDGMEEAWCQAHQKRRLRGC